MGTEPRARTGPDLALVSALLLFLELACIRWFPAHVLYLTFFTNTVLLAAFVGMSVGCLAAGRPGRLLATTPWFLAAALACGLAADSFHGTIERHVAVGDRSSPEVVYFGTEARPQDLARTAVPVEVLSGVFFLLIALAHVGPGQELGRAFNRWRAAGRGMVGGYTLNVAGSLAGIGAFAACSYFQTPPVVWFLPVVLGVGYLLRRGETAPRRGPLVAALGGVLALAAVTSAAAPPWKKYDRTYWSPYYRINYTRSADGLNAIDVNGISHQRMVPRPTPPYHEYALPHALRRDTGGEPFRRILVVGAGSGNDLSRALAWAPPDAVIDAVEIDPVIQTLGAADHADRPYSDPRVRLTLDDGRNFLRNAPAGEYDLVVYALVDSLVLHSGYSNLRLESYLFTEQAFADVKRCLKPAGLFATYNYFRQGWIVARIRQSLAGVFGHEPLTFTLPYTATVRPEESFGGFTLCLAGGGDALTPIRSAFQSHPDGYAVPASRPLLPGTPSGFVTRPAGDESRRYGPAEVTAPAGELRPATDDWPFLYLRGPMVPSLSLRGMALTAVLSVALLLAFRWAPAGRVGGGAAGPLIDGRMFFLGAGFMLIETKAVVQMALLFGSTWAVNTVVFAAVLVMILAANLFVLAVRPKNLTPYYAGLIAALAVNVAVPLDSFLGMDRAAQVALACLLVFTPVAFAGVVFAVSFARRPDADRAFGSNVAGAVAGGLAENLSMLVGFQYLVLVAVGFYLLSGWAEKAEPSNA